jgi:hypothetical protein
MLVVQGVAQTEKVSCLVAPRAKCLMILRSSLDRPGRASRLLSCPPSVDAPPLPRSTLKHAKTHDRTRNSAEQIMPTSHNTASLLNALEDVRGVAPAAFSNLQALTRQMHSICKRRGLASVQAWAIRVHLALHRQCTGPALIMLPQSSRTAANPLSGGYQADALIPLAEGFDDTLNVIVLHLRCRQFVTSRSFTTRSTSLHMSGRVQS